MELSVEGNAISLKNSIVTSLSVTWTICEIMGGYNESKHVN